MPEVPRRFERVHRVVQPHVDAGHHAPRDVQVVALEEQDAAGELLLAREVHQRADQLLPGLVRRMRLAREQEQDLPALVGEQAAQVVEVVEEQRGALVGGEAPAEADGEHVRVGRVGVAQDALEVRLAAVVARVLHRHAMAHHVEQARLDVLAHAPEDVVRDGADLFPDAGMAEAVHPAHAEEAVEHLAPFGREEGGDVHAVGDVAERVLVRRDLRPVVVQQARRNAAVDARDAVLVARAAQRERGHVEVAAGRRQAERPELELAEDALQVRRDRRLGEVVVAGGHRRVRGEHGVRRDRLGRRLERQALGHQAAHALEHQERGVALVDVPHRRLVPDRRERARAAHAEHDLLLQARDAVAAVEPVRDVLVALVVLPQVGVEQVERDVPDLAPARP